MCVKAPRTQPVPLCKANVTLLMLEKGSVGSQTGDRILLLPPLSGPRTRLDLSGPQFPCADKTKICSMTIGRVMGTQWVPHKCHFPPLSPAPSLLRATESATWQSQGLLFLKPEQPGTQTNPGLSLRRSFVEIETTL